MIIITGTSRGIGRALAEHYLQAGKRVLGISRTCALSHPNYTHIDLDLGDEKAVKTFQFPDLSRESEVVFIHNAGTIGKIQRVSDQHELDLKEVFQVNLFSGASLVHQLFINLPLNKPLSVIFISSGAGKRPIPSWAAYCASKEAVDLWLRTIHAEETEKGRLITCYAIAPGVVDTEMQKTIRRTPDNNFSSLDRFVELHENNELRKPEDVAKKIAEMLDQDSHDEIIVSF